MRILILAIILSLAACDSSGSGPYYCYGDKPIISDLTLTPSSAASYSCRISGNGFCGGNGKGSASRGIISSRMAA